MNKKYISIIIITVLLVLIIIRFYPKTEPSETYHDEFVIEGLERILTRTTDTTILNIEVYETEDNFYYLIEYSALWQEEIINNYAFEGSTWGFTIYQGSMNDYLSYTSEFEDARINYQRKIVYSQNEINAFVALINTTQ
ncbi:hypothetical protein BK010_06265 [Tenericutes bacterium MO-XQ]|nr:hypothetical protein BK010_06265 [Tenericutes bacterium MO-XQ]